MKRIDSSNISGSTGQRAKRGTLDMLQDAPKEVVQDVLQSLFGLANNSSTVYVLYGCIDTGSHPTYTISAGAVYYQGEIFRVPAFSGTLTGSNVVVSTLTITPTTSADYDPVLLTTGATVNAHNNRTFVLSMALTGTGTADFANFQYVNTLKQRLVYTNASILINSSSIGALSGFTLTTPNDGVTRNFLMLFKGYLVNSNGNITSDANVEFYNSTTSTSLDGSSGGKATGQAGDVYAIPINLLDFKSLPPNTTIIIRGAYGAGGANITLTKSQFMLIEI